MDLWSPPRPSMDTIPSMMDLWCDTPTQQATPQSKSEPDGKEPYRKEPYGKEPDGKEPYGKEPYGKEVDVDHRSFPIVNQYI